MKFEIGSSPIHGNGVFAKEEIFKNEVICEYYGIEMNWKEFRNLYGLYKDNSLNTYPRRRIWKIIVAKEEPYLTQNPVNYINEGVFPNVYLKNKLLYAFKNIEVGEELLLKYPKDYKRDYIL
jgi:SET domain-containing protein